MIGKRKIHFLSEIIGIKFIILLRNFNWISPTANVQFDYLRYDRAASGPVDLDSFQVIVVFSSLKYLISVRDEFWQLLVSSTIQNLTLLVAQGLNKKWITI